MAVRQYIGARYTPKFMGTYDATQAYEALSVVDNGLGTSYICDQPLDPGVPLTDPKWHLYGSSSGAIISLQQQIDDMKDGTISGSLQEQIDTNTTDITALTNTLNYKSVKEFGAVGDGNTDDTGALQAAFDYGIANEIAIYIPAGTYNFSSLSINGRAFGNGDYRPLIFGADRESAKLKHTGGGVAVTITQNGGSYIDGIVLKNFSITGNANTTVGLEIGDRATKIIIDNLAISHCSAHGLLQTHDMWLCSFTNCLFYRCAVGIEINGNSTTSLYLNDNYVIEASTTAYKLSGIYSEIGVLCADNCSGSEVFFIDGFSGDIGVLACENAAVTTSIFRFRNSQCDIGELMAWSPDFSNLGNVIGGNSGKIVVGTFKLSDTSPVTTSVPIASLYYSYFDINIFSGNITAGLPTGADNASVFTMANVKLRPWSKRPYIGNDRYIPVSVMPAPLASANFGSAIYNCVGSPRYSPDGTDSNYTTPVKNGDWFIENDPSTYHVAGYVMLQDFTGAVDSAKKAFIPLGLSGATADRPSTIPIGGSYFDTSLGKPIWKKNASTWVDATGATV